MDYQEFKAQDKDYYEPKEKKEKKKKNNKNRLAKKIKTIQQDLLKNFNSFSESTQLNIYQHAKLIKAIDYLKYPIYIQVTSYPEFKRTDPCHKEPWTVKWIEDWVKPGEVLFDIGANVGAYSLIAAKFTEGKAKIFAFEPSFSNFSSLCHNIIYNNCQDSIIPLQIALYSQKSLVSFNYSALEAGAALHTISAHYTSDNKQESLVYKQSVLGYDIDSLIKELSIPVPNHIKLDVDGSELDIINGAEKTINDPRLKTLMIELNEDVEKSDEKIAALLESKGFHILSRDMRISKKGQRRPFSSCVFVRGN